MYLELYLMISPDAVQKNLGFLQVTIQKCYIKQCTNVIRGRNHRRSSVIFRMFNWNDRPFLHVVGRRDRSF